MANLTLEESLTVLNASLHPFLGVGKHPDLNSSILNGRPARKVLSSERAIPYTNFRTKSPFLGGPVCWDSEVVELSVG